MDAHRIRGEDVMLGTPKVSVSVITYNHERFIGQALDGILAQELDAGLEVLVGEDCSTDGTRSVIRERVARRPEIFRVREYPANVGARRNFLDGIEQARGEYIALLDGDDYWTSSTKLVDQVAMLDGDPTLSLSFHATRRTFDHSDRPDDLHHPRGRRHRYGLDDLASFMTIPVSSAVVRRSAVCSIPEWFMHAPVGDRALWVVCATQGGLGYVDEVHGVYRVHEQSETSLRATTASIEQRIALINLLFEHNVVTNAVPWRRSLQRCYYDLAHAYASESRRSEAWREVRRAWRAAGGWNPRVYPSEPFKVLTAIALPRPYRQLKSVSRFVRRSRAAGDARWSEAVPE
jgi:glycosyltransferase involved in cell wall biosynthesis